MAKNPLLEMLQQKEIMDLDKEEALCLSAISDLKDFTDCFQKEQKLDTAPKGTAFE